MDVFERICFRRKVVLRVKSHTKRDVDSCFRKIKKESVCKLIPDDCVKSQSWAFRVHGAHIHERKVKFVHSSVESDQNNGTDDLGNVAGIAFGELFRSLHNRFE